LKLSGETYRSLVRGERRGLWPALGRAGLRFLSVLYDGGTRLRNELYRRGWKRSQRVLVPVVSVGNLTLGGTGKTPCVEYVGRFYRQRDVRVAILSRGYGSTGGLNDEALVLEENLPDVPHLQGSDRVALAETAIEELDSEVLVLDDGFQHRRLARQLDLLLLDATNPWGHGYLFPRGLLRESPRSIRRADLVVLTRCDQVEPGERQRLRDRIARLDPTVSVVESTHRPVELVDAERRTGSLDRLKDAPVAAFCGLGNPEAFRRTLLDLGARLSDFRTYADHHAYTRADLDELRRWARRQAADCLLVTTQKDLVKLRLTRLGERELWALRIQLHVTAGQDLLDSQLSAVLGP
jgi:tetraacyldisaccharide 4'-kinase